MAKKTSAAETKVNKDMSDFVKWFYERIGQEADHTDYIQAHRTIKNLLWGDYKTYEIQAFYELTELLIESGVMLDSYTIVMYPGLLRAFETNDTIKLKQLIDNILDMQDANPSNIQQVEFSRPIGY